MSLRRTASLIRSVDILGCNEYSYTYEEGVLVRTAQSTVTLSGEMVTGKTLVCQVYYSYTGDGSLKRKRIVFADGTERLILCENPEDSDQVIQLPAGDKTVTSHSKSDSFGRKVFDELQLGTGFVSRQFAYYAGQITDAHQENGKVKSAATTQLVSQIVLSDGRTLSYEYDAEERITKVTDSLEGVTEYTYDAMGQLLTETVNGEVVNEMVYDNYGNILTKNGKAYTYGDSVWKDKLTAFDGQTVTYDAQGNPTAYLGHALTWEKGRQLKSFDTNSYAYNANGIRTAKTVNGVTHSYILDGTNILKETWGENVLIPLYDNQEQVCGIEYNGSAYFFLKNLQGDVIAITDHNGDTVARYSYDAWGVCTILSDTSETGIASINPYRYRSYYFDPETALYYLQSRYYDPATGRFLNGDEILTVASVQAVNLLAYCENEPVARQDETGYAWKLAVHAGYRLANCLHFSTNQKLSKGIWGYIYSQYVGNASKMWFGFYRSSHNGCGWIATYNALFMLNNRMSPHMIIAEYEINGAILGGVFGIRTTSVVNFFKARGYKVTVNTNTKNFDSAAKKSRANIIYYWHGSGAHYVALKWQGTMFYGLNTFNNVRYSANNWDKSISKFLKNQGYTGAVLISIQ